MATDTLILGFDTSAAHCAAALLRGDEIVASHAEQMARGQAERLMPLIEEMLRANAVTWQDLDAIGVGVGPGNFTGIRISVSAARGLALGLGVPAVGVNGFDASALTAPDGTLPVIRAPREQVYVQMPGKPPALMPLAEVETSGPLHIESDPRALARAIVRITAARWKTTTNPPAPLYVRPADAAPSSDVPPVLLDG